MAPHARHRVSKALFGAALSIPPTAVLLDELLPSVGQSLVHFGTSIVHGMAVLGLWLGWAWKRRMLAWYSLGSYLLGTAACYWFDARREDAGVTGMCAYVSLSIAALLVLAGAVLRPAQWYVKAALFLGGILVLAAELLAIGLWAFATGPPPVW